MEYSVLSKYRAELMGIAMLWILVYHTWGLILPEPFASIKSIGFGGVDIFILLSAMGLTMSLLRREQRWTSFMSRRAVRILPAYYIAAIPYTVFLIVYRSAPVSALAWNATLLSYWVRSEGRFNWYISGIMLFYALIPLCVCVLKKNKKHRVLLTAVGMAAGLVLSCIMAAKGWWAYVDVIYRIPIFCLGLLLGFYVREEHRFGKKDTLFWCFWALCGIAYWIACSRGTISLPLCLLFTFTTIPMCLVISWLFEKLPLGWLWWFLRQVGESSLEIYLLNCSLFSQAAGLRQAVGLGERPLVYYSMAIPANILLGILFHRVLHAATTRIQARHIAKE